ncbi:MAG TPA: hypothetical protein VKA02_00555 [Candidatus Acidoferrum sp.]|nr:hypothetical protein [Candidatus Acidoferrum sp.]
MEDDERTKDWATREAAKNLREAREAEEAREKSERDARLKDKGGIECFKQLHAWMEGQAKSYSGKIPTQAFEVGEIKQFGGPDCHHFFKVSSTKGERLPMTISYRTAPHGITVECGAVPKPQYFLSIRDNDVFFETLKGQSKTIEELGSELLDRWKVASM